jgi:streptogramin lyase
MAKSNGAKSNGAKSNAPETRLRGALLAASSVSLLLAGHVGQVALGQSPAAPQTPKAPEIVATGIKTPGVSRPLSEIKPAAVYPVAGTPDWKVMTKNAVWVTSARANHVVQLLPAAAGEPAKTGLIADIAKPCSGLAYGWGSVWVPSCGAKKLVRVDETTGKTTADIPADPANSEGGIAIGDGAVWLVVKPSTLLRIDPASNTVAAKLDLPSESEDPFFAEGFVWITSFGHNALLKINPKAMTIAATIPVGPKPRFLTAGAGAVWTLNQGDGTVSRVDIAAGKTVATIECGLQGPGGEITFGAGAVWATLFNIPLTKIDPETNTAVKQWAGKGGDGLQFGFDSLWLSNFAQQTVWRINPVP